VVSQDRDFLRADHDAYSQPLVDLPTNLRLDVEGRDPAVLARQVFSCPLARRFLADDDEPEGRHNPTSRSDCGAAGRATGRPRHDLGAGSGSVTGARSASLGWSRAVPFRFR